MRRLDLDGNTKIGKALLRAISSWTTNSSPDIKGSTDARVVNDYFDSCMSQFNSQIQITITSRLEDLTIDYSFDTPEDEAIFILKWS